MTRASFRPLGRGVLMAGIGMALYFATSSQSHQVGLIGTPVPLPTYDVETFSNGVHSHHPAVVGVPTPVNVQGGLLPDIDVTLTLVNAEGISNPPVLNDIVRATLTINRDPTAVALGRAAPPLKVLANLTLLDSSTLQPADQVGIGYDTATGGTIPPHWDASLGGFQNLFTTLDATVDTVGGISGVTTNPLTKPPTYLGPLSLLANVGLPGVSTTDMTFGYQPFPGLVRFTYNSDSTGNHVHYTQAPGTSTHLHANVLSSGVGQPTTTFNGDVDPMPPDLQADFQTSNGSGHVNLTQHSSGRHPDASFQYTSVPATPGAPLVVNASIGSLPTTINAQWSFAPGNPAAALDASGQGLGSADMDVRNFQGQPQVLTPLIPDQRQFFSYQSLPGGANGNETEIAAHAEYVRHIDFSRTGDGFTAHANIGDGEMPMQIHYIKDDRSGTTGSYINTTATISPLPSQLSATLHTSTNTKTFEVVTDTNQTADLDGHVEYSPAGAGTGCGSGGTVCGDLKVRHVPTHLDVLGGNVDSIGQGFNIDDTPASGIQPDLTADLNIGPGTLAIPVNATTPIIGHVELFGLPPHLRARLHTDTNGNLDRAEFHTCDWNFTSSPPACQTPGPVPSIAQLAFSLRNFTEANRPATIKPIAASQPQFVNIVARQANGNPLLFEATAQLRKISEIDLRNVNGVLGVRSAVGGGQNLAAHVDIDDPTQTLVANTTVTPLPPNLDFCLRRAATPTGTTTGAPYTTVCEDGNPFGLTSPPAKTPTSVWFNAPGTQSFGLDAGVLYVSKGATPADNTVYRASLATATVPQSLTAHVSAVKCTAVPATAAACPPLRALYLLPPNSPQITMDISGQISNADSTCADPRVSATSTCFSARLQNLPTSATVCYDPKNLQVCNPADPSRNLVINAATGAAPFNILNLNLASVSPLDNIPAAWTSPGANITQVKGQILGVPTTISGFLGKRAFDLRATPPIGELDATMQNYLGPDPLANLTAPAQRAGLNAPSSQFAVFQRGDLLKVAANLKVISAAGYHQSTMTDPATGQDVPLKTKVISVGFDPGQTIRGYADIVDGSDASQTITDATIDNNPSGVTICVRSKDPNAPKANNPTWCDNQAPNPSSLGAFQIVQTNPGSGPAPNVHAFVRAAQANNTSPVNAVIDLTGIPPIVEGAIGDHDTPTYEVSGLTPCGIICPIGAQQLPAAIGNIHADVASYDFPLASIGYTSTPLPSYTPGPLPSPTDLVQPPSLSGQSLAASITDNAGGLFHAIANIGGPSGVHLQHLLLTNVPCTKPNSNRDDYPFFPPAGQGLSYTCIRADFSKDGGTGAVPLALWAEIDKNHKHVNLSNGGLTDVPTWVQATLSDLPSTSTDNTVARRCAAAAVDSSTGNIIEANGGDGNCLPALVRFDAAPPSDPTKPPKVFGSLALSGAGGTTELTTLRNEPQPPGQQLVDGTGNQIDLAADPSKGWNGDTGVRLKIGDFPQPNDAAGNPVSSDTGLLAGIILPLPGSITIDPMQSFKDTSSTNGPNGKPSYKVSELRAHFVARDYPTTAPHGEILPSLGNLAAMDVSYECTNPAPGCGPLTPGTEVLGQNQPGPGGTPVPGEVGINLYDHAEDYQPPTLSTNPSDTKELFQLELFLSKPLNLLLHINSLNETIGNIDTTISNIPAIASSDPPNYICNAKGVAACHPGATVRAELVKGPSCALITGFASCKSAGGGGGGGGGGSDDNITISPNPIGGPTCTVQNQDPTQPCVHIKQITLNLDFMQNNPPTRLVDAVIHLDKAKAGLEIAGNTNNIIPSQGQPSKLLADGDLTFDQLNMHFQDDHNTPDPFPPLRIFMDLASTVDIQFHAGTDASGNHVGTNDFQIQSDILHLSGSSAGGPSTVGPLNMTMSLFSASAHIDCCTLGTLLTVSYNPGPSPIQPLHLGFWDLNKGLPSVNINVTYPCFDPAPDTCTKTIVNLPAEPFPLTTASGNSINIAPDSSFNAGLDPLDDNRVSVDGKFGLGAIVPGLLGKTAAGEDLGINLRDGGYPSDPVAYPAHHLTDIASGVTILDGLGFTTATAKSPPTDQPPAGGGTGGSGPIAAQPTSVLLTAPPGPDGAGGFYLEQPEMVILAADTPPGNDCADNATGTRCIASVHYTIDGGPDTMFTAPFVIPPGTHTICHYAIDDSTPPNIETPTCQQIRVDDSAPTLSVTPLPGANPTGWFTSVPTIQISATDSNTDGSAGSGIAGIFTSLDGSPFAQTSGPQSVTIPVGIHQLRVYATDLAGHQSPVQFLNYQIDLSHPTTSVRTFAPMPAQNGWWRSVPSLYLRSVDGDQAPGVQAIQYQLDGTGPFVTYTAMFSVPPGLHSVAFRAIDNAGVIEPTQSLTVPVDTSPPTAVALSPNPVAFIPLLGPAHLNWMVGDDLSSSVHVQIFVYTATGDVARHLDAGTFAVTPGSTATGSTTWDGRDDTLTGILPVGLYTYRVLVTDQAGNAAQSADSVPIQLKVG